MDIAPAVDVLQGIKLGEKSGELAYVQSRKCYSGFQIHCNTTGPRYGKFMPYFCNVAYEFLTIQLIPAICVDLLGSLCIVHGHFCIMHHMYFGGQVQ